MSKLTDAMKEIIEKQLAYVSTVSNEGMPNIGPKRSMRILDENTLIYNENTGKQTMNNILANGKVAVAYADWAKLDGYRFVGKAEVFTEGKYYDEAVEWAKGKMGAPKAAVVIHIEDVYTLRSGATAGDKL
ncbi:MAG: pyridoxamine 5'-phosphate oxidase family protein [Fusobacterium necrophorum]|nr:pyridoxamine 5'-phosphate oxidase family protein [Fusobacterium necrophorum]MCI7681984.1 pyridoxamine 5'-phosphate oxidase family protein [Fusobacterium necrophorum]